MAAAEALNTLHGVGDKVMDVGYEVHGVHSTLQAIEARMKGFEDILQGIDDEGKHVGYKIINGANTIFTWPSQSLSTFIRLDVEKQGRQKITYLSSVAAEGSRAVHSVGCNGQAEALGSVWKRNADKTQGTMKDTVATVIHGAQVILTSHPH